MTRTTVRMDNCGMQTTIEATLQADGKIRLKIESDCESVQELSRELKEVDLVQLMQKLGDSVVHQAAWKCINHSACLVPAAIIRAAEVELNIALPGESSVVTEKCGV